MVFGLGALGHEGAWSSVIWVRRGVVFGDLGHGGVVFRHGDLGHGGAWSSVLWALRGRGLRCSGPGGGVVFRHGALGPEGAWPSLLSLL